MPPPPSAQDGWWRVKTQFMGTYEPPYPCMDCGSFLGEFAGFLGSSRRMPFPAAREAQAVSLVGVAA